MPRQVPPILCDLPYPMHIPGRHKVCQVLLDGGEEYSHHGSLMNWVYQVYETMLSHERQQMFVIKNHVGPDLPPEMLDPLVVH